MYDYYLWTQQRMQAVHVTVWLSERAGADAQPPQHSQCKEEHRAALLRAGLPVTGSLEVLLRQLHKGMMSAGGWCIPEV